MEWHHCELLASILSVHDEEVHLFSPQLAGSLDNFPSIVGIFPEPSQDPIIQIANLVRIENEDEPIVRNCFVLRGCVPVIGADIITCNTEEELLMVSLEACGQSFTFIHYMFRDGSTLCVTWIWFNWFSALLYSMKSTDSGDLSS